MIRHHTLGSLRLAAACLGLALFVACSDSAKEAPKPEAAPPSPAAVAPTPLPAQAPAAASPNAAESAPPSGDATAELDRSALGVFEGTLPCADCAGIRTELTLYLEPDTFSLKETHLGKNGDEILTSEGKWATLTGSATDPNAIIVQLDPDKPDVARSFLEVGGDRLELLDRNQNRIESKLDYSLKRKADDEEGE